MIKKRMITVLLCLALLATSGCVANQNESTEQEDGKINIRVIYPTSRAMGDKEISQFEQWFDENFEDAHLELISSAVTTITDTVKSEFKNGNEPDIFVTTEYDPFVEAGYMADITGTPALTNFRKSSVRGLERDGKVYALPLGGGNLIGLHYNKALFDEYHLEYPKTSESIYDVVLRVNQVIEDEDLDKRALGASLLYPSQAAAVINGTMAEITQKDDYLNWVINYEKNEASFEDDIFQNYLQTLDSMINKQKDAEGNTIKGTGKLFGRDDYFSTQSSSITSFLNGASFMYIGDVTRCYSTFGTEGTYDKDDIGVMGIPVGVEGISYVSYMDELYIGVNSEYSEYSERKKEIMSQLLNYIASPESTVRNIFTFTGDYCSNYIEGQSVVRNDDPYFSEINEALGKNYVSQEVNNMPFSNIFGKVIQAWKREELDSIVEDDGSDIEKITKILETYRTTGTSMFAKSEEPIGKSKYFMEYQSNIVRTQETAVGNQVADMARDYMNADFALLNAGGIRASIPEGDISVQTLNSVLPYQNYLVKIKVSGATLKKAIENAYNVGPTYKSGQFGDISGLKVKLKTNDAGYAKFEEKLNEWENENPSASETQKNSAIKDIVVALCEKDASVLNLEVVQVTDLDGNEIKDDVYYTVAMPDYLLQAGDGYDMLGVLSDSADADRTIEIYNRKEERMEGTIDEMSEQIANSCETSADAFAEWVTEGHELTSQIDGRISIEHFIYVE